LDKAAAAQGKQIQQEAEVKAQAKNRDEGHIFIPGMKRDGRFLIPE